MKLATNIFGGHPRAEERVDLIQISRTARCKSELFPTSREPQELRCRRRFEVGVKLDLASRVLGQFLLHPLELLFQRQAWLCSRGVLRLLLVRTSLRRHHGRKIRLSVGVGSELQLFDRFQGFLHLGLEGLVQGRYSVVQLLEPHQLGHDWMALDVASLCPHQDIEGQIRHCAQEQSSLGLDVLNTCLRHSGQDLGLQQGLELRERC
mmetsp:Transcript_89724/g.187423  ORF Transcript_89724/g.187423 Transcript_89724/m.187423 type:complete len:207 (+) Transcript_89724:542-1162(+)